MNATTLEDDRECGISAWHRASRLSEVSIIRSALALPPRPKFRVFSVTWPSSCSSREVGGAYAIPLEHQPQNKVYPQRKSPEKGPTHRVLVPLMSLNIGLGGEVVAD